MKLDCDVYRLMNEVKGLADHTDFDYLQHLTEHSDLKAVLQDIMQAYGDDVWNYAFSLTKKWDLADDITQEVFLKVYRSILSFRSDCSLRTWLLTITRNTAYDYLKASFFRKVTLLDSVVIGGAVRSTENEVVERMTVNEIWEQVLKLPVKYREVLILYGHYQLSIKEIAELLGVREGTVKSRLHHARVKITKLKEDGVLGVR
jgi:RNA polymerase sigma-70 factor (ECF subfamily)